MYEGGMLRQFYKWFFCILIFLVANPSHASQLRLAVLEFRGVGIEEAILHKLSDQARIVSANVLPEEYQVMTKEGLIEILKDLGKDASCLSGACEIEIARNVGADYIITGDILLIEGTYFLTLKLHETQSGLMIAGKELGRASLPELITDSQAANEELLVSGFKLIPQASTTNVKEKDCPWGETIYSVNAYGNYVTINDQLWEVRSNNQQRKFMEMLVKCDQAPAALSFKQWRTRRKSSMIWAASMVGTFHVAPWVALASQKSKKDMIRELEKN